MKKKKRETNKYRGIHIIDSIQTIQHYKLQIKICEYVIPLKKKDRH